MIIHGFVERQMKGAARGDYLGNLIIPSLSLFPGDHQSVSNHAPETPRLFRVIQTVTLESDRDREAVKKGAKVLFRLVKARGQKFSGRIHNDCALTAGRENVGISKQVNFQLGPHS